MDEVEIKIRKEKTCQTLIRIIQQLDSIDVSLESKIKHEYQINFDQPLKTIFSFKKQLKIEENILNNVLKNLKKQKISKWKNFLRIIFTWGRVNKNKQLKKLKTEIKNLKNCGNDLIEQLEKKEQWILSEIGKRYQKVLEKNNALENEFKNNKTETTQLKNKIKENEAVINKLQLEIENHNTTNKNVNLFIKKSKEGKELNHQTASETDIGFEAEHFNFDDGIKINNQQHKRMPARL